MLKFITRQLLYYRVKKALRRPESAELITVARCQRKDGSPVTVVMFKDQSGEIVDHISIDGWTPLERR